MAAFLSVAPCTMSMSPKQSHDVCLLHLLVGSICCLSQP